MDNDGDDEEDRDDEVEELKASMQDSRLRKYGN